MRGIAKETIPFSALPIHVVFQKDRIRRFIGLTLERHICLLWSMLSLFSIALFTGCHKIGPAILTRARTRQDVIDGQVFFRSTVLAFVIVAFEYVLPGKINALVRGVHISVKADDRRHREGLRDRMDLVSIGGSHNLTFFQVNKNKRSFH